MATPPLPRPPEDRGDIESNIRAAKAYLERLDQRLKWKDYRAVARDLRYAQEKLSEAEIQAFRLLLREDDE